MKINRIFNINGFFNIFIVLGLGILISYEMGAEKALNIFRMIYIFIGILLTGTYFILVRNLINMGKHKILDSFLDKKDTEELIQTAIAIKYYDMRFFLFLFLVLYFAFVMWDKYLVMSSIVIFIYTRVLFMGCKNLLLEYLIRRLPSDHHLLAP